MSAKSEHPAILLWYVSGEIGPEQRSEVASHLGSCEDCTNEVRALSSMYKSLSLQSRFDHVAAHDLALYEERGRLSTPGHRGAIEDHLTECADCREDLLTLRRVRQVEEAPQRIAAPPAADGGISRSRARTSPGWRFTAAAAVLIFVAALLPSLLEPMAPEPGPVAVRLVVFPAPSRNVMTTTTLTSPGPWAALLVLPFDAMEGRYRVSIRRQGGAPLPELETTALVENDKVLTLLLPTLPSAGRFELLVQLDADGADPPHVYPFESRSVRKPAG